MSLTQLQRRALAAALAALLLAVLLVLVSLDARLTVTPPERTLLREVQLYQPPPPPPPPQVRATASATARPRLVLSQQVQPVQLETPPLDVTLPAGSGEGLGQGFGGLADGLGSGLSTVGLSELDAQPMVLSAPLLAFPQHLAEQGIDSFEVAFHIIIDEQGFTYPVALLVNPHPELEDVLLKFARGTRFSPPQRLGVAVRTEYRWPVVFRNEP